MNGSAGAKLLKTMLPSLDQVPMPESSASLQELLLAQLEGEDDEDENDEEEEEQAAPDDGAGVFSPVSVKQEKSEAAADGQGVPIQDAACELLVFLCMWRCHRMCQRIYGFVFCVFVFWSMLRPDA